MMFYECCVCKRSRQDAILYHIPCNETRREKWLQCLNMDDLKKLSQKQLSNIFVCQKHFESRFLTPKSRLTGNAYPSLLTEEEILSGVPSRDNAENMDPLIEHRYTRKRHFDHTYCTEPLKETSTFASNIPGPSQYLTPIEYSEATSFASNVPGPSQYATLIEYSDTSTSASKVPGASQYHTPIEYSETTVSGSRVPRSSQNPTLIECSANPVNFSSRASGLLGEQLPVRDMKRKIRARMSKQKRLVRKIQDLTPLGRKIYKEYKKARKQVVMLKRAKRALKFSKEMALEKLNENINPYAKKIIEMQIGLCVKKKNAYRFSLQDKLIALSIMKQSPKGYRFLRRIFILPSRSTLNKMISKLNIQTGISPQIFDLLKKEVAQWDEKKKWCSLIFDEMALETALNYDKKRDSIVGFVELNEKKKKFADHALVFMLRGAVYKWQQPIAFYYCEGATSGTELKSIIKTITAAVVDCGLKPVAVICDQGSAFQSALNSFKEETKRAQILANQEPDGTLTINGVNLNIIYDPCHLIKGLRNNFLNKNIIMDGKLSKWSDIVDVYQTDCHHTEVRLLHKLNDENVIPEKIKKMKVKNCVKVFSCTMSAALSYTAKFSHYADGRPISTTLENTAETVLFFDKLFDSINGVATYSKRSKGKPLRTAVSEKSPHHVFWVEAINKLEKMKYVDATGNEKSVPSLKNVIITLKSYQRLWQFFKREGIKIMRPRYFNSDPIENFFGQVRAYNYRNNDPSCHSFTCTFKSLLITRIIKFHNQTFNCEDDPAEQVISLQTLFNTTDVMPGHTNTELILDQARRERINVHSRAYTAGWIVRKVLDYLKINCSSCKKCLTTSEQSNVHDWISHREYSQAKTRLHYPSEGAVRCFGTVITESNEYLESKAHDKKISLSIKELIKSKYSFDFIDCAEHKTIVLDYFIDLVVRFTIMNWCCTVNRILKGTDVFRLRNRSLPCMQRMALEKYNKKLKNKSYNK